MADKNKIDPVEMHTFDTSTLTGSYQVVSSGGFSDDLIVYKMYNGGSEDVTISYDGSTDHDVIPSGGFFILDIQANATGNRAAWPAGRELFVKGSASAGTLYETGYTLKRG
jgi:hypothetical protein